MLPRLHSLQGVLRLLHSDGPQGLAPLPRQWLELFAFEDPDREPRHGRGSQPSLSPVSISSPLSLEAIHPSYARCHMTAMLVVQTLKSLIADEHSPLELKVPWCQRHGSSHVIGAFCRDPAAWSNLMPQCSCSWLTFRDAVLWVPELSPGPHQEDQSFDFMVVASGNSGRRSASRTLRDWPATFMASSACKLRSCWQ